MQNNFKITKNTHSWFKTRSPSLEGRLPLKKSLLGGIEKNEWIEKHFSEEKSRINWKS